VGKDPEKGVDVEIVLAELAFLAGLGKRTVPGEEISLGRDSSLVSSRSAGALADSVTVLQCYSNAICL
jgi:hypothetical protein